MVEEKIILHKLADVKIKVLAIGKLPSGKGAARRLDFLYTPPNEYAFAVLYFTGSKIFNTVMRQRALNMGYSLNEHGIYIVFLFICFIESNRNHNIFTPLTLIEKMTKEKLIRKNHSKVSPYISSNTRLFLCRPTCM